MIDHGVVLRSHGGVIAIGDEVTLGPYCALYGGGTLAIGNGVRVGPHVAIVAANHVFDDRESFIYLQGMTNLGIRIRDDVWVGAGAKILDGVTIGHGAVIAAGAVVTRSVEDWAIVGGIPARRIGTRGLPVDQPSSEVSLSDAQGR